MLEDNRGGTFSLEEVLLRIMDSSKLKHLNNVFVYYKHTVVL